MTRPGGGALMRVGTPVDVRLRLDKPACQDAGSAVPPRKLTRGPPGYTPQSPLIVPGSRSVDPTAGCGFETGT